MKDSNPIDLVSLSSPDRESWARPGDPLDLRLWLRLLTCSTLVENHVRSHMRTEFDTTLPRFELLAQLSGAPRGLKMSDLSRRMMVTNGNITGITDQLERDGLVARIKVDTDRRSCLIQLTPKGRQSLRRMSDAYQGRVAQLFEAMPAGRRELLLELLGELKDAALASGPDPAPQ